jgi:hypothetical protein
VDKDWAASHRLAAALPGHLAVTAAAAGAPLSHLMPYTRSAVQYPQWAKSLAASAPAVEGSSRLDQTASPNPNGSPDVSRMTHPQVAGAVHDAVTAGSSGFQHVATADGDDNGMQVRYYESDANGHGLAVAHDPTDATRGPVPAYAYSTETHPILEDKPIPLGASTKGLGGKYGDDPGRSVDKNVDDSKFGQVFYRPLDEGTRPNPLRKTKEILDEAGLHHRGQLGEGATATLTTPNDLKDSLEAVGWQHALSARNSHYWEYKPLGIERAFTTPYQSEVYVRKDDDGHHELHTRHTGADYVEVRTFSKKGKK